MSPSKAHDLRERFAEDDSGLVVPAAVAEAKAEAERTAQVRAEVERRRHSIVADRAVRRDGSLRKGRHSQAKYRERAMRKAMNRSSKTYRPRTRKGA